MLVRGVIYDFGLLIFPISVFNLIYAIINENKESSKYIKGLAIIFIVYSIIALLVIPDILYLDVGLEMNIYYVISAISDILFIISIIVTNKKSKELSITGKAVIYKTIFTLLVLGPIIIFCLSYFREKHYINNSSLILVCSKGSGFDKSTYAYAISENYSETITIGVDLSGYKMEDYLPNSFHKLGYRRRTDDIKITNNNITIFKDDKVAYKINTINKISSCDVERIFYK